jgi:hypothetical protein
MAISVEVAYRMQQQIVCHRRYFAKQLLHRRLALTSAVLAGDNRSRLAWRVVKLLASNLVKAMQHDFVRMSYLHVRKSINIMVIISTNKSICMTLFKSLFIKNFFLPLPRWQSSDSPGGGRMCCK